MMLGALPNIGVYIHMSMKVAKTLTAFLLVYSPVLFGFSFAFHLLLTTNTVFESPFTSILKSLTMMIGEFDYADNFTWDKVKETKAYVSTQILFIFFFGLAAMVIVNLLIGLTVDRIEELRKKAHNVRLKKTVEQVKMTRDIIMAENSPFAGILPKSLLKRLSKYGGQFFPYAQQVISKSNEQHSHPTVFPDLKLSGRKVCFWPSRPKYGWFSFNQQALDRNAFRKIDPTYGIQFGAKYVELYLYNESTGTADCKTDLSLPAWVITKTLKILKSRWEDRNATLAKQLEEEIESYNQGQSEF